jgi:hypothetical protein
MAACPTRAELLQYLTQDGLVGLHPVEAHVEICPSCQATLVHLIGETFPGAIVPSLPGFRVYRPLGSGAVGEVWLAQDLDRQRLVAVKAIRVGAAPEGRKEAWDVLRRDARLVTDLAHPNVVQVYAWLTDHDHHYLVMEYVAGGTLAAFLKAQGPLDWQRAARYVADVGEGLLEVHGRGIVHRDVKPANILLDPRRDEALLTAFGVGARLDEPTAAADSLLYMAPETLDGRVSPAMDVYSLAATFFHLVTGSPPFPGPLVADLRQQIHRGLSDPDPRCAGLPEPLERIVRAGMAVDRGQRPSLVSFVAPLRGSLSQLLCDTLDTSGPQGIAPKLLIVSGPGAGRAFTLDRDQTIIGRGAECDVTLGPTAVSRRHAAIVKKDDVFVLADLGSRNGTFVGGQKLEHPTALTDGTLIHLGDVLLMFSSRGDLMLGDAESEGFHKDLSESRDDRQLPLPDESEAKLRVVRLTSRELSGTVDLRDLFDRMVDTLFVFFPQARSCLIALVEPESGTLVVEVSRFRTGQARGPALSKTVFDIALGQHKAVLSQDASSDGDLPTTASSVGPGIRSIMCVPLLTPDGQAEGLIQLDTTDGERFCQDDVDVVGTVASQVAIAVRNARLHIARIRESESECELIYRPGHRASNGKDDLVPDVAPLESIRRHTDISFPARVRLGRIYNLRVQIIPAEETLPTGETREIPKPHAHDATMLLDVPRPTRLDEPLPAIRVNIYVAAENFEIEGPTSAEIVVPIVGKSPSAIFRLRGEEVGPGRIMIDFVQDGRPVGSVDLSPKVVADCEEAGHLSSRGEVRLAAGPSLDAPDIVIKVFEHRHAGQAGRLHFVISSTDRRLQDLPVLDGDLGIHDLHTGVADWVEDQLRAVGSLAGQPGSTVADVTATLARVGCSLFEQLLPKTLQELCWTFRQRGVKTLLILSDEPHIPWELIKPYRTNPTTGELVAEDAFWGEAFALTRWLRGRPPVQRLSFRRVFAVCGIGMSPPDGGTAPARDMTPLTKQTACSGEAPRRPAEAHLEFGAEEIAMLYSLEAAGVSVEFLPARRRELLETFEKGGFDVLHLVSHGTFGGILAADGSAVHMEDGDLCVTELSPRIIGAMRGSAPLIFFNTCHSGRIGFSLTRLGSWGARLVELGCGGFVGTLWPVTDEAAFAFAQAFYELMAQGLPIGEVMLRARQRVHLRFPDDPTWLAYCCFADPWARIERRSRPQAE